MNLRRASLEHYAICRGDLKESRKHARTDSPRMIINYYEERERGRERDRKRGG